MRPVEQGWVAVNDKDNETSVQIIIQRQTQKTADAESPKDEQADEIAPSTVTSKRWQPSDVARMIGVLWRLRSVRYRRAHERQGAADVYPARFRRLHAP